MAGFLEVAGVNRGTYPLGCVGIGGNLLYAAAHLFFLAGGLIFYPLVVLYIAAKLHGLHADAGEHVIAEHVLCDGIAGGVNEFAFIESIDGIYGGD